MSGTRLTRKVTVEGSKKLPEGGGQSSGSSSATRRSVFDRLGPGTSEVSSSPLVSFVDRLFVLIVCVDVKKPVCLHLNKIKTLC